MELSALSYIKTKDELEKVFEIYSKNIAKWWKIYLFIDEIQEIEWWEKYINSLRADITKDVEICISWSNSKLLSWELATYLSWRYIKFNVYPFSYEEYLWLTWEEKWSNSLSNYLNIWGIPDLYNLQTKELQKNYIESLKDTVILKDISIRYWVRDVATLEKLFYFLVWNTWNLSSINSLSWKLSAEWINMSIGALSNYLRYLQEVFVFHWCDRYDIKGKKRLEWNKKYYLNDLSFQNYLLPKYDNNNGKKLENYVYCYLLQKWYSIYVWKLWDNEIDFVAEKEWWRIYVQVAYMLYDDSVIKREYWNLRKIEDSFPKYIISMDPLKNPIDQYWIIHQQARDITID
jgi:predicted AAA+ superfamily ATPase